MYRTKNGDSAADIPDIAIQRLPLYLRALMQLQAQNQRRGVAESSRQDLLDRQAAISADLAGLKAQVDALEQAETTLIGYARGAQALLWDASHPEDAT